MYCDSIALTFTDCNKRSKILKMKKKLIFKHSLKKSNFVTVNTLQTLVSDENSSQIKINTNRGIVAVKIS